ncbi:MAG: DUF2946 domain-containing protein [Oxalobacteraceae bacterium]|nr:DUF2946 domain-containing protein [Oxalobacteraceae bacterium]
MTKFLKIKPLFIWIACFAMLINALAPSISHAVNARSSMPSSPMMEICTMNGIQPMAEMPGPSGVGSGEHCPFCLPHAGSFALPPSDLPVRAIVAGHDLFPSLFYHAPYRLFSWTAANPRGPPLVS